MKKALLLEVEHFKAHRAKKDKQGMSLFECFVAEGNERAEERVKKEQYWMEELWRKSGPAQSSRKERRSTRRCSTQPAFIVRWRNGTIVKSSSQNQRKNELCRQKNWKQRSITRSGVRLQANSVA